MEAYKVLKQFEWNGWILAEPGICNCGCSEGSYAVPCTEKIGTGCGCSQKPSTCHCDCGIQPARYGGGIWMVEPGHPLKENMLGRRYAIYDSSLDPVELMKTEEIKRILKAPSKRYLTQAAKTPAVVGG